MFILFATTINSVKI